MTLDVADEKQTGDAIQLQLAVHAAFGNAKGKGKFGQKGKPGRASWFALILQLSNVLQ
jgi:hypothetical protein